MTGVSHADLKLIVKSIIISSPAAITVGELQRDFRSSEGTDIPFSALGFRNIWDFLASLSDIIKIGPDNTLTAVRSSETKHLQDLIKKQRNPKKKSGNGRSRNGPRQHPLFKTRLTSYSNFQYCQQKSFYSKNQPGAWSRSGSCAERNVPRYQPDPQNRRDGRYNSNQYTFEGDSDYTDDSFELVSGSRKYTSASQAGRSCESNTQPRCHGDDVSPQTFLRDKNGVIYPWKDCTPNPVVACERCDMSTAVPDQLKSQLRAIIREHPSGVLCSQLSRLHMDKFGKLIDCRDYEFSSMIELVDAIPNLFKYEEKTNKDWIIYDSPHSSPSMFTEHRGKVYENIQTVARALERSVKIDEFSELYKKNFGVSLSSEVKGFGNVDSVLATMDSSLIHTDVADGFRVILPAGSPVSNGGGDSSESGDSLAYPDEVLRLGCKVPRLERFSDAIVPVMEVKLGEIYSPENFYIIPSHMLDAHNLLMEQMQSFYANSDALALTKVPLKRGLYCVAPYMDKWHRAIITKIVTPILVRVFLIDFGTQLPVPKTKLRFLHTQFAADSKQAIKAKLHNVAPVAEKFSKEDNIKFFELTADKNLRAYVKGINFLQEPTVSVRLADVDQDKEFFIDEKLVAAGVAQFCQNSIQSRISGENSSSSDLNQKEEETVEETKLQNGEIKTAPNEVLSPGALLRSMLAKTRRLSLM